MVRIFFLFLSLGVVALYFYQPLESSPSVGVEISSAEIETSFLAREVAAQLVSIEEELGWVTAGRIRRLLDEVETPGNWAAGCPPRVSGALQSTIKYYDHDLKAWDPQDIVVNCESKRVIWPDDVPSLQAARTTRTLESLSLEFPKESALERLQNECSGENSELTNALDRVKRLAHENYHVEPPPDHARREVAERLRRIRANSCDGATLRGAFLLLRGSIINKRREANAIKQYATLRLKSGNSVFSDIPVLLVGSNIVPKNEGLQAVWVSPSLEALGWTLEGALKQDFRRPLKGEFWVEDMNDEKYEVSFDFCGRLGGQSCG